MSWAIVTHSQDYVPFLAPLAVNELVLDLWLIFRGFSSPEPASLPASAPAASPALSAA